MFPSSAYVGDSSMTHARVVGTRSSLAEALCDRGHDRRAGAVGGLRLADLGTAVTEEGSVRVGQHGQRSACRRAAAGRHLSCRSRGRTRQQWAAPCPARRRLRVVPCSIGVRQCRTTGCGRRCRLRRGAPCRRSVARSAMSRPCRGVRRRSDTPFGRWSNIQRILGAENIGSTRRPLRSCTSCRSSSVKVSLHHAVVRRSCHPITGPSGAPVPARQPTTDSRCVDSATPTILASSAPRKAGAHRLEHARPDALGVLLDPARARRGNPDRSAAATDQLAVRADESGFRIRRPLVDCQDQLIG